MPITARIGEMRHTVTIEHKAKTSDGQGGSTIVWTTFASVRAKVQPKIGKALMTAMEAGISSPVAVTMRYLDGVTSAMRIRWRTEVLNILSISDTDGRGRELVIECGEKA